MVAINGLGAPGSVNVTGPVPSTTLQGARAAPLQVGLGPTAAATSSAPKMTVDGVASAKAKGRSLVNYRPTTGQLAVASTTFGSSGRGFIEASIVPRTDGWEVGVDVHHTSPGDDISVFVSGRITDLDKGAESWVILGMPIAEKLPGTDGVDNLGLKVDKRSFVLSLDDLNKWLLQKGGVRADGQPKLVFEPGAPLSIDAKWQSIGHESGGRRDQRNGYLVTPPLLKSSNVVGIRSANVPIAKPAVTIAGDPASKPIDLVLMMPDDLVKKYPLVFVPKATMVSRREEEAKFAPMTFQELKDFALKLLSTSKLGSTAQAVALEDQKALGEKGWKIKTTDRYYQRSPSGGYETYAPGEKTWMIKDASGEVPFDFAGLPKVAGMYDQYLDTIKPTNAPQYSSAAYMKDFMIADHNAAVRFRDGEIKGGQVSATMGKLNVKPSGGVVNPYNLTTTRLEYALDTLPGISKDPAAMAQLRDFVEKEQAPYNPFKELMKVAGYVDGSVFDHNVADNQADRYKFTLEHQSGLELEVSLDFFEIRSKDSKIEPASTKGLSQDQKYEHWVQEFARTGQAFSPTPGQVNHGNFVEYANGGADRVEVVIEASIDAAGKKSVKEQLIIHAVQVEVEMDHVQARATGSAQAAVTPATRYFAEPTDTASETAFFANLSENLTFAGPPTIHTLDDLKETGLYQLPSYVQMSGAVARLEDWGFPNGIRSTRQKLALGLEEMGQISPSTGPVLEAKFTDYYAGASVNISASGPDLYIGGGLTSGKPAELVMHVDGFPIVFKFQGNESAQTIRDTIFAEMQKFKVLKPTLVNDGSSNHIRLESK